MVLGQVASITSDEIQAMFDTVVDLSCDLGLRRSMQAGRLSYLATFAEYRLFVSEQAVVEVMQNKLTWLCHYILM